jgi:hypothetical protein
MLNDTGTCVPFAPITSKGKVMLVGDCDAAGLNVTVAVAV